MLARDLRCEREGSGVYVWFLLIAGELGFGSGNRLVLRVVRSRMHVVQCYWFGLVRYVLYL